MSAKPKTKNKGNKGLRTGSIFKRVERNDRGKVTRTYYDVRRRYTDADGKSREKKRRVPSYNDALEADRDIKDEIARELAAPKEPEPERTFADLVAYYKANYLKPPVYVGGRKVSGLRSHKEVGYILADVVKHFSDQPLRTVAYDDLRRYKARRLAARTKHDKQRSVAAVNNELRLLRRLFNLAVRQGWVGRSPFQSGDPLISKADENERVRILSEAEARALLDACQSAVARAHHLFPLVLCALDTGMRQGEIFRMKWEDVDLDRRVISVPAFNTKTMRPRTVPVTARLRDAISEWRAARKAAGWDVGARETVFGVRSTIQNAFAAARLAAKVGDLHFHDLRHTAITWMLEAGMSPAKVMKISGHTQWSTFLRYVNVSVETAQSAADALDELHAAQAARKGPTSKRVA
ncbi:MAG: hypothetical protein QOG00_227 [Pyrinomonadaceae bacterium]|nr:hypothetical protein [Pyrinomonadaceae bacterium]